MLARRGTEKGVRAAVGTSLRTAHQSAAYTGAAYAGDSSGGAALRDSESVGEVSFGSHHDHSSFVR